MLTRLKENFKEDLKINKILTISAILGEILFLIFLFKLNITSSILCLFLIDTCLTGLDKIKLSNKIKELEDKLSNY